MRILKTPALAITACAALAACTTNPYTGEQQASKTATYGLGAAAVCGLVGAMDSSKKGRNAALGCGIVGAGGATFPTAVKFSIPEGRTVDTLIINGVECEPYLTADHRLVDGAMGADFVNAVKRRLEDADGFRNQVPVA